MAKQFNNFLREGKYLTEKQYSEVMTEQSNVRNSTIFSAIQRTKVLEEEELLQLSAQFFEVLLIKDPYHTEVNFAATLKIMGNIFEAIEKKMFAVNLDGKMTFVVNDPENEVQRTKATAALGEEPQFAIISEEQFDIFNQYQLTPRAISEQANQIKVTATGEAFRDDVGQNASFTTKLLDMLINTALDRRASDLHLLQLSEDTAQIMVRVDGELYPVTNVKADVLPNLRNKLKTMSATGGETPDQPVEGQIRAMYRGKPVDIRVNIVFTANGYDFCLRFIDSNLKGLEELGLSETNYNHYLDLLHMTKGMVILCGPTGSGKTSLLYAGFKKLLAEHKAIFTIEDPVEIKLPGITQVDVKKEKGMTYEERFPSSLRHDPDVIGIGETRTLDVAMQAVQAANTGHLVFTTLHTNDAVGAISRLTNLGLGSYTVGDVLAAVVAQRLVRRVCVNCAEEYELPGDHVWRKRYHLGNEQIVLKRGCGCASCAGTGYRGRIAVNEFMRTTPKLRNAIQKGATRTELEEILDSEGYRRYIQDAIDKALQGITTFDEVDVLHRDIL